MILGFAGKAATGKTTAAHHLAPLLDKECRIIPMAMVLRDEVEAFLRAVGADESVPLVYGDQDDKVRVFYVDEQKALQQCPKWAGFVAEHHEIQDRAGQSAVTVRRILRCQPFCEGGFDLSQVEARLAPIAMSMGRAGIELQDPLCGFESLAEALELVQGRSAVLERSKTDRKNHNVVGPAGCNSCVTIG